MVFSSQEAVTFVIVDWTSFCLNKTPKCLSSWRQHEHTIDLFMFRHKGEWMKTLIFMKTAWTYHWFMFRHKGEWMNNIIITYPAWITYKQLFIDPRLPLSWGADLQCYLLHKIFGLIL
jgi:hypothetical protein